MARDVVRVIRRGQHRLPGRIGLQLGIAELVGLADQRDGPRGRVFVFDGPARDIGIGRGAVEQREQPGVVMQVELARVAELARHRAEHHIAGRRPENRHGRLVRRALRAVFAAQALDLVELLDKLLAGRRHRCARVELQRVLGKERLHLAKVRQRRRQVSREGGPPGQRTGWRQVIGLGIGAVGLARLDMPQSRLPAQLGALQLGIAFGNFREVAVQRRVQRRLLRGIQAHQHAVRRGQRRRLGRRAAR